MTLKSACLIAVAFLLTRSAIAADPAQTPPSSTTSPAAAASPQPIAPPPSPEPLIGPAQPGGEAAVEVLDPPPPPRYRDLWGRIRSGFAMQEIDSPLVARHEAWYLNRPEYVQRMVERSRLYLYFVVEELEKRGMPTEIALLPMIESAYNPQAYSRMRAAGMWQFIPSTGKKYGLQQNFWYDGRRDVLAATRAALDYLQVLHDTFGDWELALAAYNCGESGLQRAIAKNRARHKPTDYFSLKMPKETRNYLPKLQAVKNIISNLDTLGFELEPVPNQAYFTVVNAPGHMDVVKAAQLADMPVEEFRSLNPGYNRPVMIKATARQILLPVDKVDEFQANLENNAEPLVTWQTYTLRKGETLEKVAAKFNIEVQRLQGGQRPHPAQARAAGPDAAGAAGGGRRSDQPGRNLQPRRLPGFTGGIQRIGALPRALGRYAVEHCAQASHQRRAHQGHQQPQAQPAARGSEAGHLSGLASGEAHRFLPPPHPPREQLTQLRRPTWAPINPPCRRGSNARCASPEVVLPGYACRHSGMTLGQRGWK